MSRPRSPFCIALLAAYSGILVSLTWARPLWLDEVLELLITRERNLLQRLEMIRETPGAVPLGYEVQHLVTRFLGQSVFTARAPSALFGILSLVALLCLAREIQVRGRIFAGVLWVFLPILSRYALEGRPYSLALTLSALATFLLFRLRREPRLGTAALYALLVFATMCTQPYSVFLQVGLLLPLVFEWRKPHVRRASILCGASLACAVLAFLPWVIWSEQNWLQYASRVRQDFHLTARLPLLLIREISGGSYFCSLSLLAFVATGCVSRKIDPLTKRQLLAGIGSCLVLALTGDLIFHYFFATRQVLFTLIPLCLLAGEGWEEAAAAWRSPQARPALAAVFLVAAILKDVSYFRDRSENWQSAAQRLEAGTRSACVLYPPNDLAQVYEYFEPALQERKCEPGRYTPTILLPISRYTAPGDVRSASERLGAAGYAIEQVDGEGQPIEIRKYTTKTSIPARLAERPAPPDTRTPPPPEKR